MKRHPALMSLSRDHHQVLVLAQRLRRATEDDLSGLTRAFLEQWEGDERIHFRVEEEVLLPAFAEYGPVDDPAVTRMLQDHIRIRRDAQRVARSPDTELLRSLGEQLGAHVRLEEHEVFPLIERAMPEPALAALGERLRAAAGAAGEAPVSTDSTPA